MIYRIGRVAQLTRLASGILSESTAIPITPALLRGNLQNELATSIPIDSRWRQATDSVAGFASLACFSRSGDLLREQRGNARIFSLFDDDQLTSLLSGEQTRGMANKRPAKPKMKTPSCLKNRFRMNGKGRYKRFAAGYVHKRFSKSGRQRRELKKKVMLHKGYHYVLKKLNYRSRTF
ncbi:hypothetical protein BSKO_00401 [Bryopsis sp. KO-2023]|nr:hypothetical protein BSKO_00401 [Bryopsis sp. KO-2023]